MSEGSEPTPRCECTLDDIIEEMTVEDMRSTLQALPSMLHAIREETWQEGIDDALVLARQILTDQQGCSGIELYRSMRSAVLASRMQARGYNN